MLLLGLGGIVIVVVRTINIVYAVYCIAQSPKIQSVLVYFVPDLANLRRFLSMFNAF